MMSATTAVTVTDLTCDDVRLCREANGSGSLASLAVAACHVDLSPGWSTHGRAARIAALEKLALAVAGLLLADLAGRRLSVALGRAPR